MTATFSPSSRHNGDFIAPPPGPPPPQVPEGWLARWEDNYEQFYYVNLLTKQSQWEVPTSPAFSDPPPYECVDIQPPESPRGRKKASLADEYFPATVSQPGILQAIPSRIKTPPRSRSNSFGAKISRFLKSRTSNASLPRKSGHGTPPPSRYYGGIPPQGGGCVTPQQQQRTPPPPPPPPQPRAQNPFCSYVYGAPPPPPPPPVPKRRRGFPGLKGVGGVGMGMGAGMLGGLLLGEAIDHHDEDIFQDGYQDGLMDAGDYGGDFDGDFHGDFGDF